MSTVAGEALNAVLSQVVQLNRHFTTAAVALTKPTGQTLARWLVLAECREPSTVADVARRLHLARQSVQRVADELVRDGLAVYHENPRHQRAKLLAITSVGSVTLEQIEAAQRAWSNKLGQRIGLTTLQTTGEALSQVLAGVEHDAHAVDP
jgi:DNA-binding MarR family transcriptional regulator